jgi:hypothetical protein
LNISVKAINILEQIGAVVWLYFSIRRIHTAVSIIRT